ncbi:MAG: NUDIX hydrolase [Hyphomicrobiales bacterium]
MIKRDYPDRPISAVAGVIVHNQNVLLVKKNAADNIWSFPGGAVELGETLQNALIREVYEETSIEVDVLRLITNSDVIRVDDKNDFRLHYVLSIYECSYIRGEPKFGDDVIDAAWHKLNDLDQLKLIDGARNIIKDYLR